MAINDRLTTRQRRFVAAMLSGQTVRDAAKQAGVSEKTAYRYLRNENVKQALSEALDDALGLATRATVQSMTAALATLEAIHQDTTQPAGARVSAARAILDAGPRLREAIDLGERVEQLERLLAERG